MRITSFAITGLLVVLGLFLILSFLVRHHIVDSVVHSMMFPSISPPNFRKNEIEKPSEENTVEINSETDSNTKSLVVKGSIGYINIQKSQTTINYYIKTLNPEEEGEVDTLVYYCHGNAGSIRSSWKSVIDDLASFVMQSDKKHIFAVHDYRRYGLSTSITGPTPSRVTDDSIIFLNLCINTYKPKKLIIYGRSIGGAVAIHTFRGSSSNFTNLQSVDIILETPFIGTQSLKTRFVPKFVVNPPRFDCREVISNLSDSKALRSLTVFVATEDELIDPKALLHVFGKDVCNLIKCRHNGVMASVSFYDTFRRIFFNSSS